jgi:hypothetical protein
VGKSMGFLFLFAFTKRTCSRHQETQQLKKKNQKKKKKDVPIP